MSNYTSGLADKIESYLDYREALGYSRRSEANRLTNIDRFCAEYYPESDTLTRNIVFDWIDEQETGLLAKSTVLRNLGKYLYATGTKCYILPENIIAKRKQGFAEPYIFSEDELRSLFRSADKIKPDYKQPFLPVFFPVLLRLIYTCGLRPNEGRELLRSKINFKTGTILITNTKRKKERMVVMSDDVLKLCRDYDKKRKKFARENPYFFPSANGDSLSNQQVLIYLKQIWESANPTILRENLPRICVYDFRHRFATAVMVRWLSSGVDLNAKLPYLQAYMGHGSIDETMYYIHLLPENLISGVDMESFAAIVPEVVSW